MLAMPSLARAPVVSLEILEARRTMALDGVRDGHWTRETVILAEARLRRLPQDFGMDAWGRFLHGLALLERELDVREDVLPVGELLTIHR